MKVSPDQRSIAVAEAARQVGQPDLTVLFGSRARGDYREKRSDIDILMIQPELPQPGQKRATLDAAIRSASELYDHRVEVQIVWYRTDQFEKYRRSVNHMIARAMEDGIAMPRNPEEFRDQGEADFTYEWTVTEQRVRHAEIQLEMFNLAHMSSNPDTIDRGAGKNGQEALEHALKALISAHDARYDRTHKLTRLVQQAQQADPGLGFQPSLDYGILDQYAGQYDYYEPTQRITAVPGYRAAITRDVERLLRRVRTIRGFPQP